VGDWSSDSYLNFYTREDIEYFEDYHLSISQRLSKMGRFEMGSTGSKMPFPTGPDRYAEYVDMPNEP
jgi:hypothetical protein